MDLTAEVIALPRGTFNIATIEYYCDLTHRDGRVIQIGAVAEITLPRIRGLGLIARTELDKEELELVGGLIARTLAKPFDYLVKECEEAWANTRPQEALAYMLRKTKGSLVIGQPQDRAASIPIHVLAESTKSDTISTSVAAVRKLLSDMLDDKMLEQIWNTLPPSLSAFQRAEQEKKVA